MINRTTLTGRLTRDVDLRYTPNGAAVGNFTLAVDRRFTNQNGEREADFINCVIWRKSAENFANFTHKGALVGIDGRLQTRNYENQQGQRVYVTEVVVENFALLEPRSANKGGNNGAPQNNSGNNNPFENQNSNSSNNGGNNGNNMNNNSSDPFANSGDQIDISDDDLPF
ncbi:single-stranded DNA-binding protein [Apilactobacillus timberlakei]|uniref:Single-stranded DNA-binding protein n=1 Tax=Apilactobacillus timberlakei TaxID=2008380 RepID=A0ABY2YS99_9LACO|nr:single-stranded DNA-binding protein [Apilactobacillus timberlakei]TPR12373.1 single-stranded DNA-binding protein [Apilactobacillus timberlakei]TPR12882.1 single-stranded DNA-binding protein [Apilactobacillus timberlakei]TPR14432.1 single-stranded DNA-binding protein [Apilactobacillus timberlakei]TPR19336.1 single-stranded DNA-binding protein [Apilactobacillus timberlakei]